MVTKCADQNQVLIASKVKAARIYSFGTIAKLAAVVHVSNQALLSAERHHHNSSVATLINICHVTGMPPIWLFDETACLSQKWKQAVTIGRITKHADIPETSPWSEFVSTEQQLKIDKTQYGRLRRLSRLLATSVEVLCNQLLNEGIAIREARLQEVSTDTFDIDLFQAIVEMYETFELTGQSTLSREEKSRILKSVYFDLVASGTQASDVSLASMLKLMR